MEKEAILKGAGEKRNVITLNLATRIGLGGGGGSGAPIWVGINYTSFSRSFRILILMRVSGGSSMTFEWDWFLCGVKSQAVKTKPRDHGVMAL